MQVGEHTQMLADANLQVRYAALLQRRRRFVRCRQQLTHLPDGELGAQTRCTQIKRALVITQQINCVEGLGTQDAIGYESVDLEGRAAAAAGGHGPHVAGALRRQRRQLSRQPSRHAQGAALRCGGASQCGVGECRRQAGAVDLAT